MTTTEKLHRAQQRVHEQQAQAARKVLLGPGDLRALGISYSRQHIWRLVKDGRFPAPVALGPEPYARKAWRSADVDAWLAALPTAGAAA